MLSGPRDLTTTSKATAAEQSLRLTTRPAAPTKRDAGYVHGAWLSRSRDLSAELPALCGSPAARLGAFHRVTRGATA